MVLGFTELRSANVARSARYGAGGVERWTLSDWAVGFIGEFGEACNIIKDLTRARDGIAGNKMSEAALRIRLGEELADAQIFLDLLAAHAGIDLAAATISKFNRKSIELGFPERLP